ncbi:MAG: virulence factor SrfB [Prevotella sp.]|nr:virulence factor SrfB [Prevotella sp.]
MEHLIANSGIHFIATEKEFNPAEQLAFPNGKILKYAFCETADFITGEQIFDLLYYHSQEGLYIPLSELRQSDMTEKRPNGREELDDAGLIKMKKDESTALFSSYQDGDSEIFNINSLAGYRVKDQQGKINTAFDLILGKWLPMPMFEKEIDGVTAGDPFTWCRVRIDCLGEGSKKGNMRYRFLWAFDTTLGDPDPLAERSNTIYFSDDMDESMVHYKQPFFYEDEEDHKEFCLCNRADELLDFMSVSDYFPAFSDYFSSLLGQYNRTESRKYIGYYIYLVNFIRTLGAAPEIMLHNNQRKTIDVDLVLDIGNSRTCGVLFEEGDFTKAAMLEIRDLSDPNITYEKSFDMRLAFRKADFGNAIVLDDDTFEWKSLVRVGDEAKRLVYRSLEEDGLSEKTTNYSSPKRYLWDEKPFDGRWEFLTTIDDPSNVRLSDNIYIARLSDLFDHAGNYIGPDGSDDNLDGSNYSRASLMTFVLIEILQQAAAQINSIKFRTKHGNMDCKRLLRNIIITCPTAMPRKEQEKLRRCAENAIEALQHCTPAFGQPRVIPTSASLRIKDDEMDSKDRMWSFDEASCCQLVYLYAEIAQRYSGEIHKFIELKGHVRPEEKAEGYEGKSLTIGTIDIGAGTTDVMICSYQYYGEGRSKLVPTPLYWDSFYLAGDEILHNLVQNLVIEGKEHDNPNLGNIFSALYTRLKNLSDEELQTLPCLEDNQVYRGKMYDIISEKDNPERRQMLLKAFASNLLRDFFGFDSSMMTHRDRRCRVDFNTQISVPIAQTFMEHLRLHRPLRTFTFDDLFAKLKPADYLLEYFEHHFGFSFTELNWRFDPQEVATIVKNTLEPLMKQLSVVLYAHHCDVLILAGRPSSLDAITELFIKYIPTPPDRLIRLNDYRIGTWYPFADGQGYFYDQKSVVAVGGMVGYLAANQGFNGMSIDFSRMIKNMKSTACYLGNYNSRRQQVTTSYLTPTNGSATIDFAVFPAFIGCKQFNSPLYQARPLYAIYNHSSHPSLRITLSRNYYESREDLIVEEAMDDEGNTLPKREVELVLQSIVDDGKYWLDKGEFELSVK